MHKIKIAIWAEAWQWQALPWTTGMLLNGVAPVSMWQPSQRLHLFINTRGGLGSFKLQGYVLAGLTQVQPSRILHAEVRVQGEAAYRSKIFHHHGLPWRFWQIGYHEKWYRWTWFCELMIFLLVSIWNGWTSQNWLVFLIQISSKVRSIN